MDEQGSSKGLWAGLILSVVAAIVFAVLWFMRGGDIDSLKKDMAGAQSAATTTAQRLERDLQSARSDIAAAARKASELEARVTEEQRKVVDAGNQAERRFRSELDSALGRLAQANRRVSELEAASAKNEEQTGVVAGLRGQIERLTQQHAEARTASENAANDLARAKATIAALEQREGDLRATVGDLTRELESANAETQRLSAAPREGLADASGAASAEVARLSAALAAGRETLAGAEKARAELAARLEEAAARAKEREAALGKEIAALRENADQAAQAGIAEAERKAAELAGRLDAEKAAKEKLLKQGDGLRERLSASRKLAAEAEEKIAALTKQFDAEKAAKEKLLKQGDGLRERLSASRKLAAEAEEKIAALTKQFDAEKAAKEKLLKQGDGLRERLSASRKLAAEAEEKIAALAKQFDAEKATKEKLLKQGDGLRERLSASRKQTAEAEEKIAALAKQFDAEKAAREKLLKQGDGLRERLSASRKRVAELEAESARLAAELTAAATPEAPAAGPEQSAVEAVMDPGSPAARLGRKIVRSPQKHLGQIVELLSDGKTYLVNSGGAQGVRRGMQFDVHRYNGERVRYIGRLEIVNVLSDDFSMATVMPDQPVNICPVTGRAVRFSQVSPFARTADDAPIAVRSSTDLGIAGDTPAIGDYIDSPM